MRTAINLELIGAAVFILAGVLALTGTPRSYAKVARAAFALAALLMIAAVVTALSDPSFLAPR